MKTVADLPIYRKDVRQFVRRHIPGDWPATLTGTGHLKVRTPAGTVVIIPSSPSDGRWQLNVLSDLRKALSGRR